MGLCFFHRLTLDQIQVYNELDGLYELNSDDNLSGKKVGLSKSELIQ